MTKWNERIAKQAARLEFFEGTGPRGSYMTLPGPTCEDIKLGLSLGTLSKSTIITACEQEPDLYLKMKNWLKKNIPAKNLNIPETYCSLSKVKKLQPLDLIYLDYNGNLTIDDCLWFKNSVCPRLINGCNLGVTVAKAVRANLFIPSLQNMFISRYRKKWDELFRRLVDSGRHPKDLIPHIITYGFLFKHFLLDDFAFRMTSYYYGEAESPHVMMLLKFDNIKSLRSEDYVHDITLTSDIEKLMKRTATKPRMVSSKFSTVNLSGFKNPVMVLAGKKSWITRRANEERRSHVT